MTTLSALMGVGGGGSALGGWSRAIFSSASITFTENGVVHLSLIGAGAGGAFLAGSGALTGPNSAPWGRKRITVSAGDVLALSIAAGGAKGASTGVAGTPGGASTVSLNGSTIMTVQGSEPGVFAAGAATANPNAAIATVTGADFWVKGLQSGSAQASSGLSITGGAAPDILQTGLGSSPSTSGAAAGTVGGSIGTNTGGAPTPWIILSEWGFSTTDGTANATVGAPGRGGSPGITPGHFGGGRGIISATDVQNAGFGAGGGSGFTSETCFPGGNAYAYMTFTPEV